MRSRLFHFSLYLSLLGLSGVLSCRSGSEGSSRVANGSGSGEQNPANPTRNAITESSTPKPGIPKQDASDRLPDAGSAVERPDIVKIQKEFLEDAYRYGRLIPKFNTENLTGLKLSTKLGEGILGVCTIDPNSGERNVEILQPSAWPREWPSARQFRMTVYHELGHCLLEYSHTKDKTLAIMAAYSFSNAQLEQADWELLLAELYSGKGVGKVTDIGLVGPNGVITINVLDDPHAHCDHHLQLLP